MDPRSLDRDTIEAFRSNFSVAESQTEHLQRCWAQQTCGGCLDSEQCSWCPYTWSCVPNAYKIPLLAPAYDENLCPHWAERWEVRTRPLGCNVSSITSLTAIVSVLATIVVVLLIGVVVLVLRRWRRLGKNGSSWSSGWRSRWRRIFMRGNTDPECDPLLPQEEDHQASRGNP